MRIWSRLAKLERAVQGGTELTFSFAQLVQMAVLRRNGLSDRQALDEIGPPSAHVRPGEPTPAELIVEATARRTC